MAKHAAHTATRDEVLATRTGSLATYCATADNTHAPYWVLGPVPGNGDAFYATGRHGNLVMVQRTGTTLVKGRGPQVRVRIAFAVDTGDRDGTLAFGAEYIGGVAPKVLFA